MHPNKNPWTAAGLVLAFGPLGEFYLGWRQGLKASVYFIFFVLFFGVAVGSSLVWESAVFFVMLYQVARAREAYKMCKLTAAPKAELVGGVQTVPAKPPFRKRALRLLNNAAFCIVLIIAMPAGCFMALNWHMEKIRSSIHGGMTIPEVLAVVHESGLVRGFSVHSASEEMKDVALSGPRNGQYGVLNGSYRAVAPEEATQLLQQNMVPDRDYNLIFTFTRSYGAHWSFPVVFTPEGRVKEVKPYHTWD